MNAEEPDERTSAPIDVREASSRRPSMAAPARPDRSVAASELAAWALGVGVSIAVFAFVRNAERERLRLEFEREALRSFDVVKRELAASTDVLAGYASHLALLPRERCGSQAYARDALARHPSLRGLSWDALVMQDDLRAFEREQAQRRPSFRVVERTAAGELIPVAERARYVVVTCIEPEAGNEKAIGFDLASDAVRREAIERTLASHVPAATARIRLVQETGRAAGVLVLQSVVDAGSGRPVGLTSAVLRIDDVFERALPNAPEGMSFALFDKGGRESEPLYTLGKTDDATALRVELPIDVADRAWVLTARLDRNALARRRTWHPWAWAAAGIVTTWLASRALRSERRARGLLRNVLPEAIAERLEKGERRVAERYESVTVLFADIVGFTALASRLGANEIVRILDDMFSAFDRITDELALEKIKTIGDCYMAVGGLSGREDHVFHAVRAGQRMLDAAARRGLCLRVGVHVGPAVAGVIGRRRLAFDLWGDTVNVASRMEAFGVPGRVVLSEEAFAALGGRVRAECREALSMKGLGPRRSWVVLEEGTSSEAASRAT